MYIISKNKDYYDGVVGSVGMDKTIIYERELIVIEKDFPKPFVYDGWRFKTDKPLINLCNISIDNQKTTKYDSVSGFIVGFCGKLYLGWKLSYEVENRFSPIKDIRTDIVYGYENVKEFIKDDFWGSNLDDDYEYFKNYEPIEIFREFKSPIFVYDYEGIAPKRKNAIIINPILKDYKFFKVVDAFTAFTELQMFISGVLGTGENDMIEIDDKYKIKKHGFDKWSFRKEPKNERKNRKN